MWHENYDQVVWFRSLSTQFNYTDNAVTGFNFMLALREFDDMGLAGVTRDEWKWKTKVMEAEALKHLNKAAS